MVVCEAVRRPGGRCYPVRGSVSFQASLDQPSEKEDLMSSTAEFLAGVPLFSSCTPEEIEAIAQSAQEESFDAGQIIVTQGMPGQAFYLVTSGRVEIVRDGRSLGAFGVGDFFGEMSLLDNAPRSATIRAIEPTTCIMLSSWDFKSLLEKNPSIAVRLLEVLSRRLRVADERLSR